MVRSTSMRTRLRSRLARCAQAMMDPPACDFGRGEKAMLIPTRHTPTAPHITGTTLLDCFGCDCTTVGEAARCWPQVPLFTIDTNCYHPKGRTQGASTTGPHGCHIPVQDMSKGWNVPGHPLPSVTQFVARAHCVANQPKAGRVHRGPGAGPRCGRRGGTGGRPRGTGGRGGRPGEGGGPEGGTGRR